MTVLGGRNRQVNVQLDPSRLQSFNLTAVDVQRALATQNVEIPGGMVDPGEAPIDDALQCHQLLLRTRRYHSHSSRTCFCV